MSVFQKRAPSRKSARSASSSPSTSSNGVFLGNDAININEIGAKLRQKVRDPANYSVFVRADGNVPFGAFAT